ncbi:MAG: DUF2892 domain-containing protein [Candidatus Omnitrophica bacterium]|jgi:hypothetical protein|nr:DUF2892 domain-containing protein [Candidatus Omnitrophota bacterium]MDD5078827.1 DUF2892 domain-containing protein [Candidatus Omnitrophota bacterium]
MVNMGKTERIIRIVTGAGVIIWGLLTKNVLGLIGLLPLITGLVGWCGLYKIMGNRSCCGSGKPKEEPKEEKPQGGGCCCGGK